MKGRKRERDSVRMREFGKKDRAGERNKKEERERYKKEWERKER